MPEGPSIVILREEVEKYAGEKVVSVSGNSKIDQKRVLGKKIIAFKSFGKHFLICFKGFTVRVHLLMFGSYRINEKKDLPVRLSIKLPDAEINLYSCAIKMLEGDVNDHYDWSVDVMNDKWDPAKAKEKLKTQKKQMICDALLDQDIFAGVGNIIKNEILYRVKVHPESVVGKIPATKLNKLVEETRKYSFEFLEWKKKFELRKHYLAHTKKTCLRCDLPFTRKHTGLKNRRSFFCTNCQVLYK